MVYKSWKLKHAIVLYGSNTRCQHLSCWRCKCDAVVCMYVMYACHIYDLVHLSDMNVYWPMCDDCFWLWSDLLVAKCHISRAVSRNITLVLQMSRHLVLLNAEIVSNICVCVCLNICECVTYLLLHTVCMRTWRDEPVWQWPNCAYECTGWCQKTGQFNFMEPKLSAAGQN